MKKKLQFDVPQAGDKELDELQELYGHDTRVDLIQQALSSYYLVMKEAFSQQDTRIQIVTKDKKVESFFPSKLLRNLF